MSYLKDFLGVVEKGLPPEGKVPFIGRMDLWYTFHQQNNSLPPEYRNWPLKKIHQDLGIGLLDREVLPFKRTLEGVEIKKHQQDLETRFEYHTPYGIGAEVFSTSPELKKAGIRERRKEHLFKTPQDYPVIKYILTHTKIEENLEEFEERVRWVGEDGIVCPLVSYSPAHELMQKYFGYEKFYYEIADHPSQIEELLELIDEIGKKILGVILKSSYPLFEWGGNFEETLLPPSFFKKYLLPFFKKVSEVFRANQKVLVCHTDGNMKNLLPLLLEAEVMVAEAFAPAPMTNCTLAEVKESWQNKITIWGGIPSIVLSPSFPEEEFESFVRNLFREIAPGDKFILGFGDNVPTDAEFGRIIKLIEHYRRCFSG
jgi:hypothetical protein